MFIPLTLHTPLTLLTPLTPLSPSFPLSSHPSHHRPGGVSRPQYSNPVFGLQQINAAQDFNYYNQQQQDLAHAGLSNNSSMYHSQYNGRMQQVSSSNIQLLPHISSSFQNSPGKFVATVEVTYALICDRLVVKQLVYFQFHINDILAVKSVSSHSKYTLLSQLFSLA